MKCSLIAACVTLLLAGVTLHGGAPRAGAAAPARRVFAVAAYGANGDGQHDDRPAIQRALDAAIAAGPGAEVVFAAGGTYRLAPQIDTIAALQIAGAHGLTVSGKGATLIAHPSNRTLAIYDARNLTLGDLTLDYDPLPFTQVRLTEAPRADGAVRFRVEPGYAPPSLGDETLYRDFKSSDAVFLHGDSRKFTHAWGRLRSVKALDGQIFEAYFHAPDAAQRFERIRAGDFLAIKRHFPEAPAKRDHQGRFVNSAAANVYVGFSSDVHLQRITSYAAPVMTFVATGSQGVTLDGCRVMRKPNTERLIAGNSDGAHFKSLTVMPQVRDSVFEALMDDSINIKISGEVVKEVRGLRVRLTHADIAIDDIVIAPGQSLLFLGGAKRRRLGVAKVVGVERVGYRELWATLDASVPDLATGDLAFLCPTSDAVVSGCQFRSQLKTALLVYPPASVSNCTFTDVAYGIHAPFSGSIEGPPPSRLRVTDCQFIHPSVAALALHLPALNAGPPGRKALLAERCRITLGGQRGLALSAFNQEGITLRNVQVTVEDGRERAELVRLRGCVGFHEEHVTFAPAK